MPEFRWMTRLVKGEARDVKVRGARVVAVASWRLPVALLDPGDCASCGAMRVFASGPLDEVNTRQLCSGCGISAADDLAVHLRFARAEGSEDLCEAAEHSASAGRQVLAAKLATAAAHFGPDRLRARLIRLRQLEVIGLAPLAVEEGLLWLERGAVSEAWIAIARLLARVRTPQEAIALLDRGLTLDPDASGVWLCKAELRLVEGAPLLAGADAIAGLKLATTLEERAAALDFLADLAERLVEEDPIGAIEVIDAAAPLSHRDARLSYARARAELGRAELSETRRWLLHTLRLSTDHPSARTLLEEVEVRMNLASTTRR